MKISFWRKSEKHILGSVFRVMDAAPLLCVSVLWCLLCCVPVLCFYDVFFCCVPVLCFCVVFLCCVSVLCCCVVFLFCVSVMCFCVVFLFCVSVLCFFFVFLCCVSVLRCVFINLRYFCSNALAGLDICSRFQSFSLFF
jgi:hypothetical protein